MSKHCLRCGAGCYGDYCFRCKPRKSIPRLTRPRVGKHTRKDRAENKKFRDARLNHEGYLVCECCGSWAGSDADHVESKGANPHLRYEMSNKRILCRPCHQVKTSRQTCQHRL